MVPSASNSSRAGRLPLAGVVPRSPSAPPLNDGKALFSELYRRSFANAFRGSGD